ncbi:DUF302 domain-containing protein [Thiomicrorhabdus sp. zzn3]|uniref:DUF302 domain-containing protein n=1 Tax=Thiomicrorhabdus sp. zzn3 TaxID=3039775 RepID=UPI002436DEAF|nr:DUF302 domain-containing protein [Thiomicrorhabdus sp. zzn3]MDG6777122.1 DUF302 domain-containing protein [Thiomicrorhabdus sp. zzn3]
MFHKKLLTLCFTGLALLSWLIPAHAEDIDGLTRLASPYSAKETMDRLETAVKAKNLIVFARINHAAGAAKVEQTLRPTELLIFGHPKGGTPFMQCAQTLGIDLPLKALVWEDETQRVWIGFNDPLYLAKRHHTEECAAASRLQSVLNQLTQKVIQAPN